MAISVDIVEEINLFRTTKKPHISGADLSN